MEKRFKCIGIHNRVRVKQESNLQRLMYFLDLGVKTSALINLWLPEGTKANCLIQMRLQAADGGTGLFIPATVPLMQEDGMVKISVFDFWLYLASFGDKLYQFKIWALKNLRFL